MSASSPLVGAKRTSTSVAPRRKLAGHLRASKRLGEVRFREQIGKHLLVLSFSGFDPYPTLTILGCQSRPMLPESSGGRLPQREGRWQRQGGEVLGVCCWHL